MRTASARQLRFVEEYLIDLNATSAAIRSGYSKASARTAGYQLLMKPAVCDAINEAMTARSKRIEIEQDEVLADLVSVLRADASAICEYRRTCCRYCYGSGNRYQRTRAEMERDRVAHNKLVKAAEKKGEESPGEFDEQGGLGWDPRRDPSDKCQECFGSGVESVHMKDTRTLIGGERRLFDGVKQSKDGIEVKVRDRTKVAELIGRHLGMFNDKLEITKPRVRVKDMTGRKPKPKAE